MLVLAFLGSLFSSIRFGRLSSIPEPCSAAKVIFCIVAVVSLSIIVVCSRTPINLSFRGCVVMAWLEWCPDPQQPDAQWVKIFHPGSWTPHEEHDAPPPPHTYREWREFYVPNPDPVGEQLHVTMWYKRDWATEGYRRVAAPQAGHEFDSMCFPDHHSVATQSAALSMSPQLLEAILRSSDAADFSTEELTRLQEGISQQLTARARHASQPHQPVRASRGITPSETVGVSEPYRPGNPSDSGKDKASPIFELTED